MSVFADLVGQDEAVETLRRAAAAAARIVTGGADVGNGAMTHAWIFTGPPGSGRSNAARAFAAALQCPDGGCGQCHECRTALDGSHADVKVVVTEGLSIQVRDTRDLVQESALRPSVGRWRVIIIEDADRLTERAADALLKALEEPTPRTVWMLCAPSLEDVIITIRSRSRHVRLRTPPVHAVAELLQRRDGIDGPMALHAARAAQSHIGLARRLARDEGARIRRRDVIAMATRIVGVGDAIGAAADLAQIADEESTASTAERDAAERARLLETLGADPTARTQPPHIRSQIAALEKEQKTRATRHSRDMIDRSLVDLMSVYRDALVLRLGSTVDLVNPDAMDKVRALSSVFTAEQLLGALDAITEARDRINANVPPLLALEAMALRLRVPRDLGL
jgi:DNA polymerase-3 subunit delta'